MKSKIIYLDKMNQLRFNDRDCLIIYDKAISKLNPKFNKWISQQKLTYKVSSGESLKSLDSFARHIKNILNKIQGYNKNKIHIVAIGGGTLGDFVGFVASIVKRGVPLVQVPTTWLSCCDSAHGGKNALNVNAKNQLGTFYFADEIIIVKELLSSLSTQQEKEGLGEYIKTSWIQKTPLFKNLTRAKKIDSDWLWKNLPYAIKVKNSIVKKDPFEQNGPRHWLNLGHTLGHILENYYAFPHGVAVAHGLIFTLNWSFNKKWIDHKEYTKLSSTIPDFLQKELEKQKRQVPFIDKQSFFQLAQKDKKIYSTQKIQFVFLKGLFKPHLKKVHLNDYYNEAVKQGWAT
ncbi:MAG: 3-dehydroquinate synthase [Bdellovibrionales bacterium]|nr:3-dehydroquinate synthase [Bdellovibrionales bacterium]